MGRLLLIVTFTLVGCIGKPRTIDPLLLKYVESFENHYGVYYPHDVVVSDLPDNLVGRCWQGFKNKIEVDSNSIKYGSDLYVEQIVYHELGHCIFKLKHDDSLMSNTDCHNSIMNSYTFGETLCYSSFHEYYLNQLEAAWKNSLSK